MLLGVVPKALTLEGRWNRWSSSGQLRLMEGFQVGVSPIGFDFWGYRGHIVAGVGPWAGQRVGWSWCA